MAVAVSLAAGLLLAWAASWKADALTRLQDGAESVVTSAGPQQVAERGEGSPILLIHGAPGGYDQGLALATALGLDDNHHLIAPSRPGYLGTPLATGLLPEQQADALASLLAALEIPAATVVAFGEGVPAAVHFAIRHPQRVTALVLVGGVYERTPPVAADQLLPLPRAALEALPGDVTSAWIAREVRTQPERLLFPALRVNSSGSDSEVARLAEYVNSSPGQLGDFSGFMQTLIPISPREIGLRNDMTQLGGLPPLPAEKLPCPTLVIHGVADRLQPLQGARAFATKSPLAQFLPVEGTGHLTWLGPDAARSRQALLDFLEKAAAPSAQIPTPTPAP